MSYTSSHGPAGQAVQRAAAVRPRRNPFATLALIGLLLAPVGCARGGDSHETAASSTTARPSSERAPSAPQEATVPAAILGEAPPPHGQAVHYVPGDTVTTGYLAVPEGEGPFPSLILIHEWNGLVDRVRQVADEFADRGYMALAVDLYRGRTGHSQRENIALMREARANPDAMIANLNEAVRFVRARDDVTGKVATMGWCFGGGVALSFALGGVNHEGTAIFYGQLVQDPKILASIHHPIYGTFAGLDRGIPPAQVDRFAHTLRDLGIENDIHVYDDVNHGFWLWVDRDRATAIGPAADAWARLTRYLKKVVG